MSHFFVGDSHLGAVVRAYRERLDCGASQTLPSFVWLSLEEFKPHLVPDISADALNPALQQAIQTYSAKGAIMVMSIAGNHHNILGLLNQPEPFDLVLPSEPDLPLVPGHRVVPAALVEAALREMVAPHLRLLKAITRCTTGRKILLQSPPPIPSEEHITANPDLVFRDKIAQLGVTQKTIRYKLWRLHSMLFAAACDEVGVPYVSCPPEAVDEAGFLLPKAWGEDATHASNWYGELVISQVERLVSQGEVAGD